MTVYSYLIRDEVCAAISILDDFGIISGLKLNLSTCEGFGWGEPRAGKEL